MKVLMFGWEFPPHISGGLGTACYGMTQSLSKLGTEISFVLPKVNGSNGSAHLRILGADQINVEALNEYFRSDSSIKFISVESPLLPYMNELAYRERLQNIETNKWSEQHSSFLGLIPLSGDYGPNLMNEVSRYSVVGGYLGETEQFDIIHAHDWMTYLAAIEAKKKSKKPLVVHVHATEFDRSGDNINQNVYEIEKHGMESADLVVTVSYRTRQMVINRYGIPPEKVEVVHNGMVKDPMFDRDSVTKNFKDRIILFLGRVTMQKGPDYFVEAARIVLDHLPNVRFVMAGTGDMLPRMIERVAELRMIDRFHFTGFLKSPQTEKMYAMSDLFVMPSVSEPFGLTPVEAMLYGTPVIISKQSGVAEILRNAIQVDFWDVQKLADAMINVINNSSVATNSLRECRREMLGIDWDLAAQKIIKMYEKHMRN